MYSTCERARDECVAGEFRRIFDLQKHCQKKRSQTRMWFTALVIIGFANILKSLSPCAQPRSMFSSTLAHIFCFGGCFFFYSFFGFAFAFYCYHYYYYDFFFRNTELGESVWHSTMSDERSVRVVCAVNFLFTKTPNPNVLLAENWYRQTLQRKTSRVHWPH